MPVRVGRFLLLQRSPGTPGAKTDHFPDPVDHHRDTPQTRSNRVVNGHQNRPHGCQRDGDEITQAPAKLFQRAHANKRTVNGDRGVFAVGKLMSHSC